MLPKLVIWGTGGHAMVVADIIRLRGEYELVGFIDDTTAARVDTLLYGVPVLGGREQLDGLLDQGVGSIVMGFGNTAARLALTVLVRSKGFSLSTAIHPRAVVGSDVSVGAGSVIKAGSVIDPDVTIGENVIVGACVAVGHGSVLEDGVRLSAGASLPGNVTVGRCTMIGAGASLRDRLRVGAHSIIGAGAVVVHDIPEGVVAYGNPARVVRRVAPEDAC